MLILAFQTYAGSISRRDDIGAANCLELRNQYSNRLQGLLAESALDRELMGRNNTFIDFIDQELTEGV